MSVFKIMIRFFAEETFSSKRFWQRFGYNQAAMYRTVTSMCPSYSPDVIVPTIKRGEELRIRVFFFTGLNILIFRLNSSERSGLLKLDIRRLVVNKQ